MLRTYHSGFGQIRSRPLEQVTMFYNQRYTAEQHIKEGKTAVNGIAPVTAASKASQAADYCWRGPVQSKACHGAL